MSAYYVPKGIRYDLKKKSFDVSSNTNVLRYLKGLYPKRHLYERHVLTEIESINETVELRALLEDGYDVATPFSYQEAFAIEEPNFRALVFGSINISDMIKEMGHERIKVEGIPVKRKEFSPDGRFLGYKEFDSIYEVHRVNGEKIEAKRELFALKCWCTSTNKEHWIWIEPEYKDDPLAAIASTFRIHENLIPHIKELKRQGDIMIVEMNEEVMPEGNVVPLTKEQYFGLLTAES